MRIALIFVFIAACSLFSQKTFTYIYKKNSIRVQFVQRISKKLKNVSTQRGSLSISGADLFKWEVKEPEPSWMIYDGSAIKIYTPPFDEDDRGQLVIQKIRPKEIRFIVELLRGKFAPSTKDSRWTCRELTSNSKMDMDCEWKSSFVSELPVPFVALRIRYPKNHPEQMAFLRLKTKEDEVYEVEFSHFQEFLKFPDEEFNPKLPKNTDIHKN